MGLIMLILIGCAPTAYALNRTLPASDTPAFVASAQASAQVLRQQGAAPMAIDNARPVLKSALERRALVSPNAYGAIIAVSQDLSQRVQGYGALSR
ncbi:hypothetical protein VJJ74_07865, partial [Parvimonas micra]